MHQGPIHQGPTTAHSFEMPLTTCRDTSDYGFLFLIASLYFLISFISFHLSPTLLCYKPKDFCASTHKCVCTNPPSLHHLSFSPCQPTWHPIPPPSPPPPILPSSPCTLSTCSTNSTGSTN